MRAENLADEGGENPVAVDCLPPRARILMIDDDFALTLIVRRGLASQHLVITARDGLAGFQTFLAVQPDLVLLDATMPGLDGWEVLRRIRERSTTPVIMLTADDAAGAVIRALRGGADDYVTKPFTIEELQARVQVMLQRGTHDRGRRSDVVRIQLGGGRLELDLTRAQVQKDGRIIDLSATEFRLLALLAARQNALVSVSEILKHVWGPEHVENQDYVKTYVRLLRRKIEDDPSFPRYLIARRGRGYGLVSSPGC